MNARKNKFLMPFAIGLAVVAVVILILVAAYKTKKTSGPMPGGKGGRGGARGSSTVSVKTMKTEITTLHGYISSNGEVESQNSVSVFPDMGGKVMDTKVMLGSVVTKGQIIAYVDPSEPGTSYRSSPVYAPISGSVISTPLKNGTKVTTNNAIAIIGDINNLQVTANVPERHVAVLKPGLKANVSVEAYPGVVFPAIVTKVSPVVDSVSRTKEIVLNFDSFDERVNAGMFAKVILYTEDYTDYIVMPTDAVVQNGEDYYTYVVNKDSKVSKRKIKLGHTVDSFVQITEGVEPGEIIVIQ